MTLTYRLVKGSALTFAEADGNISDLNGRIVTLEGTSAANPIDSITISGNQLTFHYTTAAGGGSDTVTIPTATWKGRGEWQPSTSYAVNDVVEVQGYVYLVLIAHTSQSTFDAGYQIGGNDVYDFLFGPLGITKSETLPTPTYTLQGTDNLKFYRCSVGCAITIPTNASVAIPNDSEISFRQGTGSMSFTAASGVTLNVPIGFTASTNYQGAVVTIKKVDTDTWDIFGALVGP